MDAIARGLLAERVRPPSSGRAGRISRILQTSCCQSNSQSMMSEYSLCLLQESARAAGSTAVQAGDRRREYRCIGLPAWLHEALELGSVEHLRSVLRWQGHTTPCTSTRASAFLMLNVLA